MRRRTIELRSGTWEWTVVDPDDPRARARARLARAHTAAAARGDGSQGDDAPPDHDSDGSPPLPGRHIELRSMSDQRHLMCVRVPPHLGNAGDEAAVRMLALNPDRRTVVTIDGGTRALWPEHHQENANPAHAVASRGARPGAADGPGDPGPARLNGTAAWT